MLLKHTLLLLLSFLTIVKCLPNLEILFPEVEDDNEDHQFTKMEIEKCLDLGNLMPALNPETKEVECYGLATPGPCKDNEWFVMELNEVSASCSPRICSDRNQVYYRGDCLDIGSIDNCGPRMELLPTSLGFGECGCLNGFYAWTEPPGCYQEHTQGPCPDQQQIAHKDGEAVCEVTDCPPDHLKWSDGKCYNKVHCSEDGRIILDTTTNTLKCNDGVNLRSFLVVPTNCDDGSELNSDHECKVTKDSKGGRDTRLADSGNLAKILKLRLKGL